MSADVIPIGLAYRELVAEEVRAQAARKRITGARLAAELGMSPMSMSRRITGHHPFDVDELAAVADVLGVPITDLLPVPRERARRDSNPQPTGYWPRRRICHRPRARFELQHGGNHAGMSRISDTHISEWIMWQKAAGGPQTTIELRAYYLQRLAKDHPRRNIATLTTKDLVRWLAGKPWAPATRSSARSALRRFYSWAADPAAGALIEVSPAERLPTVRVPRAVAHPTPEPSYRHAVVVGDERIRLAVLLAGQCGLRRGELARLHTHDLTHVRGMWALRIHGKGRHERLVPLPDGLVELVRNRPEGWLFPSPQGGHLTPHHLGRLVSRALGSAGGSTHGLRHRCATVAYQGTTDLRAVQQLLGHQRPETTAGYVLTDLEAVRGAMLAAAA